MHVLDTTLLADQMPLNSANQRPGNLQRAEWRKKCRQILSDYLSEADHMHLRKQLPI